MIKRKIIFWRVLLLVIFGIVLLPKINNLLLLWNDNTLQVTADSPLSTDNVKIEFGISVNTINRVNDLALFENRGKYSVLFDGEPEDGIANEYGENDFLVTYADQYYLSFRQFKFNRRNQHDYNFHFYQKNDSLFVHVKIDGPDDMEFERPMLEIAKANEYRCNVPVDSAGTIYNMIELK